MMTVACKKGKCSYLGAKKRADIRPVICVFLMVSGLFFFFAEEFLAALHHNDDGESDQKDGEDDLKTLSHDGN